jgi:hypothetical protein
MVDGETVNYRDNRFCSPKHDVKFDHLKADARDAKRAERAESEREMGQPSSRF